MSKSRAAIADEIEERRARRGVPVRTMTGAVRLCNDGATSVVEMMKKKTEAKDAARAAIYVATVRPAMAAARYVRADHQHEQRDKDEVTRRVNDGRLPGEGADPLGAGEGAQPSASAAATVDEMTMSSPCMLTSVPHAMVAVMITSTKTDVSVTTDVNATSNENTAVQANESLAATVGTTESGVRKTSTVLKMRPNRRNSSCVVMRASMTRGPLTATSASTASMKNVGVADDAHEKLAEDANGEKMMADDASMEKDKAEPVPVTRSRAAKACLVVTSASAPASTITMRTGESVEAAPATMHETAVNDPNGDVATDGGATSEASGESGGNAYERVEVEQARVARREARQQMKRELAKDRIARKRSAERERVAEQQRMSAERLAERRRVADDAMKELDERKQQRAHDEAEGRVRQQVKPARVSLVQHRVDQVERRPVRGEIVEYIGADDGLPTAIMEVSGARRHVKFDSGASVFGEIIRVEACIVSGCTDEFLLGVDFMREHGATMDFDRNEIRYTTEGRIVVIPFRTSGDVTPVEVAVAANDDEVGVFLPTKYTGAVMLAATVTKVKNGKAIVPAVNAKNAQAQLPARQELGQWVPLDSSIELLQMNGELRRERIHEWLNGLSGSDEPLEDETNVNIGTKDDASRKLIVRLLRVYRQLTADTGDCPPATVLSTEHHIDTGDAAPVMLKRRRQAQAEDSVIESSVKKMLAAGVIEEGDGAWGFPVVLVRKKDGEEFDFDVQYRPGATNVVADALSRAPTTATVLAAIGRRRKAKRRAAAAPAGTADKIAKSTAKAVDSARDEHQTEQVTAEPRDSEKTARTKNSRGDLLDVHDGGAVRGRPQPRGLVSEAGGGQPLEGGDDGQREDDDQRVDEEHCGDSGQRGDDDRHEADAVVIVYGGDSKLRDADDERDQLPRRRRVTWASNVVGGNESDGQQNYDAATRRDDKGRHTGGGDAERAIAVATATQPSFGTTKQRKHGSVESNAKRETVEAATLTTARTPRTPMSRREALKRTPAESREVQFMVADEKAVLNANAAPSSEATKGARGIPRRAERSIDTTTTGVRQDVGGTDSDIRAPRAATDATNGTEVMSGTTMTSGISKTSGTRPHMAKTDDGPILGGDGVATKTSAAMHANERQVMSVNENNEQRVGVQTLQLTDENIVTA
ncbi:Gag-pol fusion protein [Phytophthora cinnamomi]|uniref:Gag-pol fusion protein n=1 Tax=Phytophthora cinnamomi TaxID=4785 RepID=UPI003559FDA4|nr:Gag-pol fusion protein [Phytophthora cinnamomi]